MAKVSEEDLTAIYYTCNIIPEGFADKVRERLLYALNGQPLISISHKPLDFGRNAVVSLPRHHLSIYRQALIGAMFATTKYIALCEDDALYSPEHFKYRPSPGKFAYNVNEWGVYTWQQPAMFTHKGRRALWACICERQLFIDAMKERFTKYPLNKDVDLSIWSEPGKYERQLGVTVQQTEEFYTNPPNIVFSHEKALAFENLGTRKRLGELRAYDIPYWGTAENIRSLWDA